MSMDELRRSVAEIIGCDPETWPEHGNAPLAIAAIVALGEKARERLYGKGQHGGSYRKPDGSLWKVITETDPDGPRKPAEQPAQAPAQAPAPQDDSFPHCHVCDSEFYPFCPRRDCPGLKTLKDGEPTKHTSHLMKLIRAAWKGDRAIAEAYASHLADLLDAESDGRGKYVRQMLEVLRGERAEVFVRAMEQPAQAHGWQPIETAPRDGTTVIVARHMGEFGWIRGHARWVGGHGFVAGWVSHGFDAVMGELGLAHPTHWQPLPPPPSAQAQEGGK